MRIQSTANSRVIRSRLVNFGKLVSGKRGIPGSAGDEIRAILLYHLVRIIHREFLVKSAGRVDRYGGSWEGIKPETKAYSKPSLRKGLDLPGPKYRPTLSPEQDMVWREMFKEVLNWVDYNYLVSRGGEVRTATKDEKIQAGKHAWVAAKDAGAVTLLELLGSKQVPILIETGRLERSLRPGTRIGKVYTPPNKDQIPIQRGFAYGITLKVPYADAVNSKRHLVPRNTSALLRDVWEEARPEIESVIAKYLKK